MARHEIIRTTNSLVWPQHRERIYASRVSREPSWLWKYFRTKADHQTLMLLVRFKNMNINLLDGKAALNQSQTGIYRAGVKLASNWRSIRSRNRGPNRQNVIQIVGTDNISIAVNLSFLWKAKSSFVFYANWARRSRKREKTATSPKKIVTKTTKTWFNGRMTNSTWHRYVSIGIFENILKK